MMSKARVAGKIVCVWLLSYVPGWAWAQSTNLVETNGLAANPGIEAQQVLRSHLQVQEQLHGLLLVLQENQQQTEAEGKRTAEGIATRLSLIEQALTAQRSQALEQTQSSNRLVLVVMSGLGGLGLMALLLNAWFQMRAMSRLSEMASGFSSGHLLGPGQSGPPEPQFLASSSVQLLGALERLEKRVLELAEGRQATTRGALAGPSNGQGAAAQGEADSAPGQSEKMQALLSKAQAALDAEEPEGALPYLEEALGLDGQNTDALLKKGAALEKLKKMEDALACFDRAISLDPSLTLAYLRKGAILNQLERYSEGMKCYEHALRDRHKPDVT